LEITQKDNLKLFVESVLIFKYSFTAKAIQTHI